MPQFETPDMTHRFPDLSRPQQLGHFIADTAIAPEEPVENLPGTDTIDYPEITATEEDAPVAATVDDNPGARLHENADTPQLTEDERAPATQDDLRALHDTIRTAASVHINSDPDHSGRGIGVKYEEPLVEVDIPAHARELLAEIPVSEAAELISYHRETHTGSVNERYDDRGVTTEAERISRIAFTRRERAPANEDVREVRVDYATTTIESSDDGAEPAGFECTRTVQAIIGPEEHLGDGMYYDHDLTVDITRTQELDHAEVAGVVQYIRDSEPGAFNDAQEYGVQDVPVTTEDLRTLYDTARKALAPTGDTERSDTGRTEQERPIAESDIPNRARRFLEKVSIKGEADVVSYAERLIRDDTDGHIAVQFVRREENSATGDIRQWRVDYTIDPSDLSTVPRDGIRFTRGAEGRYDPARTSRSEFLAVLDTYDWNTDNPTHAVSVYDHARDANTNFNTPLYRSELNEVVSHLRNGRAPAI